MKLAMQKVFLIRKLLPYLEYIYYLIACQAKLPPILVSICEICIFVSLTSGPEVVSHVHPSLCHMHLPNTISDAPTSNWVLTETDSRAFGRFSCRVAKV